MFIETSDSNCIDVHYGIGGGTSSTRELDIRVHKLLRITAVDEMKLNITSRLIF